MFSESFKNISTETILKDIDKKGYFSFDNALSKDFIDSIIRDVNKEGINLNSNNISGCLLFSWKF